MSGPYVSPASAGGVRAKDSDRQQVIDALQAANVNGQLSLDEYDQRSRAASAAVTLADLAPLLADLQDAPALNTPDAPPPLPGQPDLAGFRRSSCSSSTRLSSAAPSTRSNSFRA